MSFDVAAFFNNDTKTFLPGYWKDKPRPRAHLEEIRKIVVNAALPDVLAWLKDVGEDDVPKICDELLDVIDDFDDGFKMCLKLTNNYCWDCDSMLVEILDNLIFYSVRQKAIEAWVIDNDINPKLKVREKVIVPKGIEGDNKKEAGVIINVHGDDGYYSVFVPEFGHVTQGPGTHGILIPWEVLEKENER